MQQKTIFLSFYKAKDYFFDLGIKTKELCLQYICSWETPEACSQKCSSKRTNIFLEEHHWGTASGTFGNVLHYFSVISPFFQMQSTKETQEAVSQMCSSKKWTPFEKKTFGELLLELLKEFSIVFLCSVLLLSTFLADIFQVLFTYCVISLWNWFWLWRVFISFYFCCPRISSMQMWHWFLSPTSWILLLLLVTLLPSKLYAFLLLLFAVTSHY